ncbi:hypothetical protein QNA23_15755 [Rhodococcus erythropolis]|uniref:hypothetical protein n=1 Tax=Rhodococcus TaxID=1827 RepID=UPI00113116BF|nr:MULTISPECIES: hypothetical protein [Rhodococcus]MDJ0404948.1 hypothetical protein [Rhodococcus erythropolis]NRH33114.1 hypothetical protein [Rhodococcus sp. MS13]
MSSRSATWSMTRERYFMDRDGNAVRFQNTVDAGVGFADGRLGVDAQFGEAVDHESFYRESFGVHMCLVSACSVFGQYRTPNTEQPRW